MQKKTEEKLKVEFKSFITETDNTFWEQYSQILSEIIIKCLVD